MINNTRRIEKLEKVLRLNDGEYPCPDISTATNEAEAREIYLCMLKIPRKRSREESKVINKKMSTKKAEKLYLKYVKNIQH